MITIEKCSEYNVRIMKAPDFKNKVHGYNFSYPLMNTIDICNLFISGGSAEISMNGAPKSVWSFDESTLTLNIIQRGKEQNFTIQDPIELGEAMMDYFNTNKEEVMQKTLETNLKKSKSQEGNQNAKKDNSESTQAQTSFGSAEKIETQDKIVTNTGNTVTQAQNTDNIDDLIAKAEEIFKEDPPRDWLKRKIIKQLENLKQNWAIFPIDCYGCKSGLSYAYKYNFNLDFYQLYEYLNKFPDENIGFYYYWIVSIDKLKCLNKTSREILKLFKYDPDIEVRDWRESIKPL